MRNIAIMILVILGLTTTFSFSHGEGDAERGKILFNDPALGGSTNEDSCNTCHTDGSGIENAGSKKFTTFMDLRVNTLEDVINICIEKPLEGKALDKNSHDMNDIVSYIKSLDKK